MLPLLKAGFDRVRLPTLQHLPQLIFHQFPSPCFNVVGFMCHIFVVTSLLVN